LPADLLLGLGDHAREIYLAGQARGQQANVFAKVGDSITVSPQFLTPIGYGQFNLRDYAYLADVVHFYGGGWARTGNAFVNTSLAAKGGWSTFSVLAGSLSDKTYCRPAESPLLCEYRLTRPAVALIMLGTNDVLGTHDDAYVANLRRIVADTAAQGILPVLSTLPPFLRAGYEARAEQLNALILAVAQEHQVPVWNYWAALQPLPNHGMSPDGVHPAWAPNATDFTPENLQYGSTVRNLTALQVLDALWRQVMYP
jgi:lysophospholipase L1-like esterase